MVTFGFCQTGPRVRIPAPHPIFVFLAILLLSGSSMAADLQVSSGDFDDEIQDPVSFYSDVTLAASVSSPESLARVVGGDVFGIYWSTFGGNGKITSADGYSMTGRADGVQDLATATYSTFKAVEASIVSSNSDIGDLLRLIYGTLQKNGDMGTVYTRLLEVLDQLSGMKTTFSGESVRIIHPMDSGHYTRTEVSSFSDFLYYYFDSLFYAIWAGTSYRLTSDGGLSEPWDGKVFAGSILAEGFSGLAHLMFGDVDHEIKGLNYLGRDYSSVRGSWSLADITANGMQGLATLIGGLDDGQGRRAVWQWIDPTDPLDTSKIRNYEVTSLFDLFHQIAWLQNSLAKLEYVYASEEDMEFKKQEEPNLEAVKDSFFGDGEGAVNPDQIKDAAGISSAAKDAFGGAGSPGDAFTAINDSQSFWFFSQEVADALDTVNAAAPASEEEDDFMDQFVQDEDGFYSLIDLSPWDVSSYLGGER